MSALTRRTFLAACGTAVAAAQSRAARPNIVLIVADDLGWGDVGMNGCQDIRTPHIDALAKQGIRFGQFYANAPECTPTRCALLTGRYQQRVGGLECAIGVNNIGRYDEAAWLQSKGELGLPATELTMPRILRGAGYDTAITGKWHLGYAEKFWPDRHGFDYVFTLLGGGADYYTHEEQNEGAGQKHLIENGQRVSPKGYITDIFTDKALAWLAQRKPDKPFFLYLPYTSPHLPVQSPADYDAKTGTAPHKNRDRKAYAQMVEHLDSSVGRILSHLEKAGSAENTIVIFLSDNGGTGVGRNDPFRGQKSGVFEGGIRVACCMRWPKGLPSGRTTDQVSLTMDLLPTLASAIGATIPGERKLDGMDLLPILRGRSPAAPRTVLWRYKRASARRKAVRDRDWKYTFDSGSEALFNIAEDRQESRDLLDAKPEIARRLKAKLHDWEQDVQAPRLRGFPATAAG